MGRYVFCPWMPQNEVGKDVAEIIQTRTKAWNEERATKDKSPYTYVGWMPETTSKITLTGDDQVYIKGHHAAGADFISDLRKDEQEQKIGVNRKEKKTVEARKLDPEKLTKRFCQCFAADDGFTGKIKFFNCSSGVNGGESFAKKAADRLRAVFPTAVYIGYEDDLEQNYGDYLNADAPSTERRKLGRTPGDFGMRKRAKSLHVHL